MDASKEGLSLSVITVCRNAAATIETCLESVQAQTCPPEHIVIDGASTDGTREILELHGRRLGAVVSEPDHGIYDAMNKGLALATGDVVGFLNADDFYPRRDVLRLVQQSLRESGADSCYGDLDYVDPGNTKEVIRAWRSGPYDRKRFYWGWMPPHPTFFVRRRIYERYGGFNPSLGTAADYELMLRFLLKGGISTIYLPEVLVCMRSGGASNSSLGHRLRANRMDRVAWKVNGLRPYPWTLTLKPLLKIAQFRYTRSR